VFLAYADDIAVAVSSESRNGRGMSVIRKVVELVDRWLKENGLQILSTTKTKKLQQTPPLHQYQRKSAGRGGSTRFEHPKEFQGG
jgi:hypothetical protein